MSDHELRLSHLLQIPVFALQDRILELSRSNVNASKLQELFRDVLNKEPRILKSAIRNLTRYQLTLLISADLDLITDADIITLFEAYRYGVSPSFYTYQMSAADASPFTDVDQLKCRISNQFDSFDSQNDNEVPFRQLNLMSLSPVVEGPGTVEANYRYLQQLDYIDAQQRAVSTYQTLYGFFWISFAERYVVIHARSKLLKYLRTAIEKALGASLTEMVISEQLQNELPFLDPEKIKLGIFTDSDPMSENFQFVKVKSSTRHQKQFDMLRNAYPEMKQANYADTQVGNKRTTIAVSDKGLLRVYGRNEANQVRNWCLESVTQVVSAANFFFARQQEYINTFTLEHTDEFNRLNCDVQKHLLQNIVAALVSFKRMPGIGVFPLGVSSLQIASAFGDLVKIQIPFPCQDVNCEEGHYYVCPTCGNRNLTILNGERWTVSCSKHPLFPLELELPLQGDCEKSYSYSLEATELASTLEIFLGRKLLGIIKDVVMNNEIHDCSVDFDKEIIFISGGNYVYHPNRTKVFGLQSDTRGNNIYNYYSDVTITESPGAGVGTHSSGQHTILQRDNP